MREERRRETSEGKQERGQLTPVSPARVIQHKNPRQPFPLDAGRRTDSRLARIEPASLEVDFVSPEEAVHLVARGLSLGFRLVDAHNPAECR